MVEALNPTTERKFLTRDAARILDEFNSVQQYYEAQDREVRGAAQDPIYTSVLPEPGVPTNFLDMVNEGRSLDEISDYVLKEDEITKALRDVVPFTSVDYALANDPDVAHELFKQSMRLEKAGNLALSYIERNTGGGVDAVYEIVDQLIYDTFAGYRDIAQGLRGEGTEITELSQLWANALRSMDDEEFEEFVKERFDSLNWYSDAPGSDMAWPFVRELAAMQSAGYVIHDENFGVIQGIFSLADIGAVGSAFVPSMARAGRSVVGRLRSAGQPRVATETAEKILQDILQGEKPLGTNVAIREPTLEGEILDPLTAIAGEAPPKRFRIDPDAIDAELVEDLAPTTYQTRVRIPGTRPVPPVSQGIIGKAFRENYFIQAFQRRASTLGFGVSDIGDKAGDWIRNRASELANSSGTRVIDHDIPVFQEGLEVYKASFTLGKTDGQFFSTIQSAQEVAKTLPGSTVIDIKTGLPPIQGVSKGTFGIKVETGIPTKDLVSPLSMENLRLHIVPNILGRASWKSDRFMSNLADAADFTEAAYRKDIQKALRGIRKNLRGEHENVALILETLRDTPTKGNARAWLTTEEFFRAYRAFYGKDPTRQVLKGYEDLVRLSDFSWFTLASERLRGLFDQQAFVLQTKQGAEVFIFPETRDFHALKQARPNAYVWDAARERKIRLSAIPDNTLLFRFNSKQRNHTEWAINVGGKTRTPTMEDAFPYNAGGPRSNPNIKYFVGNADGNWNTLIGARSEKDGNLAAEMYNKIAFELNNLGIDDLKSPALSAGARKHLDDVVRANNKWNPNIETIDEFLTFTKERGISPTQSVVVKARGQRLSQIEDIDLADKNLLDINLEKYVTLHRHDVALVEFGGEKAFNPDPVFAVAHQFNQMVSTAAKTKYTREHPTAWVQAVIKGVKRGDIGLEDAGPYVTTDVMKVNNWKISGTGNTAKKLREEQRVIKRRLDLYNSVGSDTANHAIELLHDVNPKLGSLGEWVVGKVRGAPNTALSLGFMERMAEPSQLFLQAAHIIPMSFISRNGIRGVVLASVIRQAARSGSHSLSKQIYEALAKGNLLSKVEADALLKHLSESGRGYMKGALIEDPSAAVSTRGTLGARGDGITAGVRGALGAVGDVARAPFYAGENFSATVSRITSFLDIRRKYPQLDFDDPKFWSLVQARDRDISLGLNSAQRSMVQGHPIGNVVAQWTSYSLSVMGHILFKGETMTVAERARLAFAAAMLYGFGATGFRQYFPDAFQSKNETVNEVLNNGIDVLFDEAFGVKVGDRVALNIPQLMDRFVGTFMNPGDTIPAITITRDTASSALAVFSHALSGRYAASSHSLERLIRSWKVIDSPIVAYTMMMEDVRRSRTGSETQGPFTTSQELFQALGIAPSEAVDLNRLKSIVFNQKQSQAEAIRLATPLYKEAVRLARAGKYESASNLALEADAYLAGFGLSDTYRAEAQEKIIEGVGRDELLYLFRELVEQGYSDVALEFGDKVHGR